MTGSWVEVFGTRFQNPVLLASGTAGFGREISRVIDLDALGGIVTKAVSPEPRDGNPSPRVSEFPAGMINSVGLANPGVERVASEYVPWLSSNLSRARVLINVVGYTVSDYELVLRKLSDFDVIVAFELNVSCPNTARGGEEFGADESVLSELVTRCRQATDKPIIVKLAPHMSRIEALAEAAAAAGADGFTTVNTLPGLLFAHHGTGYRLGAGRGGVSGPPIFPVGVLATRIVSRATGKPVIGLGGIRGADEARQYLEAGASLVGVGTAFLADPRAPEKLARNWGRWRR